MKTASIAILLTLYSASVLADSQTPEVENLVNEKDSSEKPSHGFTRGLKFMLGQEHQEKEIENIFDSIEDLIKQQTDLISLLNKKIENLEKRIKDIEEKQKALALNQKKTK